jgi:hypothetical protein
MMFNKAPATESAPVVVEPAELIPLSHFALDHPQPAEGWSNFLGRRGITLRPDDIGRDSIRRSDAQTLLYERRAEELRQRAAARQQEQEAVEADERRRALIWKGVPADAVPVGATAASVMLAAAQAAEPKRTSVLEHALSNSGSMEYHAYPAQPDEE